MNDPTNKIRDERTAAAIWSNIAEPGDTWGGALRRKKGVLGALQWAMDPFTQANSMGPGGEVGPASVKGWKTAHKRWQTRLASLDYEADLRQLENLGGRLIVPGDEEWPDGLYDLEDRMPPALWVVGAPLGNQEAPDPSVSIVGSRAATSYGARVAGELAFELTERGVVIVSGGAYGIDAAAHRGALDARDLRLLEERAANSRSEEAQNSFDGPNPEESSPSTIVIICGGLGNLYPPGNRRLFDRVLASHGTLVAEVPPSFRPARWRFLERNRLIAAWSEVTVVVEAGVRSGALATANRAADLGREVGAVPGRVDSPASMGPHRLLREGAFLVGDSLDVMAVLDPTETGDIARQQSDSLSHEGLPRVSAQSAKLLHTLPPLARRVWDALPLMGEATASSVAEVAGVSEDEAGSGLLSLHIVGLAHLEGDKWRRSA